MVWMRKDVLTILGFIAEWLLFTFSLHQAVIELSEQKEALDDIKLASTKYRSVSPFYWLFPPLKVWLEKKRMEKILHDITVNTKDFDELFGLSNRAIAWAYLAVAEIFISAIATNEVLEIFKVELSNLQFVGVNLLLIILGLGIVVYRTSDFIRGQMYQRYKEGH